MNDLTRGPVVRHLLVMAAPILTFMVFQVLYLLVDLYFVAGLGTVAIAGVSAAGNVTFLVHALRQVMNVGAVALISQAAGRKDMRDCSAIFTQSMVMSVLCGALVLIVGCLFAHRYMEWMTSDHATIDAGARYLRWFMPQLALSFVFSSIESGLRAIGIVQPTMIVYVMTVVINILLAPILIAGWGTGYQLGVAGAGLASSLASATGLVVLGIYFYRLNSHMTLDRSQLAPRLWAWRRILSIGLPAGGEMLLMFVSTAVIYWTIKDLGSVAQAGFGVGARLMQVLLMPASAIAFAAVSVAGQNYGAGLARRVKQTFSAAAALCTLTMLVVSLTSQLWLGFLVQLFTTEPDVVSVAVIFLQMTSLGLVARGITYACSGLFQGLGNVNPSLLTSCGSLLVFAVPAVWISRQSYFRLEHVWYLWLAAMTLQAIANIVWLRSEFNRRLGAARFLREVPT
jgi:putative MATE family efflux protein